MAVCKVEGRRGLSWQKDMLERTFFKMLKT